MGNCQAIDNASLVIQHPTGKVERLYSAISAAEVMKLNPEVMKGLMAKKNGKISSNTRKPISSDQPAAVRFNQPEKTRQQMKTSETDRRTVPAPVKSSAAATKPRGWHPSLNSISEASS
ncbi:hypothetical protein E3N88_10309 [Mikania micrantha]|uniref:Uncharacterized protein n=1 Tax=Mikania micrantha TaxID=192012 RepID=A0A5N6PB98_9ASTR|nr:hypothetical protein E3N88_10309 [Mikania micrantha]